MQIHKDLYFILANKIVPLRKLKYIFYYKRELMLSAVSVEKEVFKIVTMGSRG